MLEKPDISEVLIISCLQEDYGLHVAQLTFLPLGADQGTAVYRAVTDDGTAYFLKLRKGFDAITVTVPLFLKAQGIQAIIAPLDTKSGGRWSDIGDFKIILYPFIEGKDGFQMELSDHHRQGLEFIKPPTKEFYGIEALFKDGCGNRFSLTEHPKE